MSTLASDVLELIRLGADERGALIDHLLRELAARLIGFGCGRWRGA